MANPLQKDRTLANLFRLLPQVDIILKQLQDLPALKGAPRTLLKNAVNSFLDHLREEIKSGRLNDPGDLSPEALSPRLAAFAAGYCRPHFCRVLNATGVVVHTNLGRSILAKSACQAVAQACERYSNLEFNLETGARGSRYSHVEALLCALTGAESALVVNNNAAAVLIILETLAKGREVIVSRGELVEIGGSFRIPEVMAKSGATLREVGATNRTHLRDYQSAINESTSALLKVHTSNYRIIGFTSQVGLAELSTLARAHSLPLIEDLGSGNLVGFSVPGLINEPSVRDSISQGADVVSFSGDKVLGGPQAGIIVGKKEFLDRIKKNPLNRALRIDKMTLAALEATLRLYLDPDQALERIPTLRMIASSQAELAAKAKRLAALLRKSLAGLAEVATCQGASRVGGGAYPEQDLPTTLVTLAPLNASLEELKARLLETDQPLVGRVEQDKFCLDPRTIEPDEFKLVAQALAQALA